MSSPSPIQSHFKDFQHLIISILILRNWIVVKLDNTLLAHGNLVAPSYPSSMDSSAEVVILMLSSPSPAFSLPNSFPFVNDSGRGTPLLTGHLIPFLSESGLTA
jgi:hypothetical protein